MKTNARRLIDSWRSRIKSRTGSPSSRRSDISRKRQLLVESLESRVLMAADVVTDKLDYSPGETVNIAASNNANSGTDFAVGEQVKFQVLRTDGISDQPNGNLPWYVTDGVDGFEGHYVDADGDGANDYGVFPDLDGTANGAIDTTWYVEQQYLNSSLLLQATGLSSGAEATQEFTDSSTFSISPADGTKSVTIGRGQTGGLASIALTVPLGNGVQTPTFSFFTSPNGALPAGITATAIASFDTDGSTAVGTVNTTAALQKVTYNFSFSVASTVSVGTYNLRAVPAASSGSIAAPANEWDFDLVVVEPNTRPVLAPINSQIIDELTTINFTAVGSDADLPAQTLTYHLDATSLANGMTINSATGEFNWTPSNTQGGASYQVTVTVTDNGTFPSNLSASRKFSIVVLDVNTAPVLSTIGTQNVDEETTLSFSAAANDQDLPVQTLTYSLDAQSLALGMTIDASTGAFSWSPDETRGGHSYAVTITVTDDGGNPDFLSDSETFSIDVKEVNVAPVLATIGNKDVDEQTNLSFTASATDHDQPAQTLTYSLDAESLARGMTINPVTGEFSWTPTESQGGSSYSVVITVTDDGSNPSNLSDSETITINVAEVNAPPQFPTIGGASNLTVDEMTTLTFTAAATDQDLPAQTLTYSLDSASLALGMTINAATGLVTWTPTESQGGATYSAIITATDTGSNPSNLSASKTVTIDVIEVNRAPSLAVIPNASVREQSTLTFPTFGTDPDLPSQSLTYSLNTLSVQAGMSIDPVTGVFTFTPAETLLSTPGGSGYFNVTVTVTDNGANPGPLSASRTFRVTIFDTQATTGVINDAVRNERVLQVFGTTGNDTINVNSATDPNYLRVVINGVSKDVLVRGPYVTPVTRIVVYGDWGNDVITIAPQVNPYILPSEIHGGKGNDTINGGSGPDLILGEEGDDRLYGNGDRDLLIGGKGSDFVYGNDADDILIGGFTSYDRNVTALDAIFAEWRSARTYSERMANIGGTGVGPRANGNYFLISSGTGITVFDDGVGDGLQGDAGSDWFFANLILDSGENSSALDNLLDLGGTEGANDTDP